MADFPHRDRVDPGKGFVQQQVFRIGRQTARDFHPPPFAARQGQRRGPAQMGDRKLGQQFFQPFAPLVPVGLGDFQHGQDVVLDRQARERSTLPAADSRCPAARGGTSAARSHPCRRSAPARLRASPARRWRKSRSSCRNRSGPAEPQPRPAQSKRHIADHQPLLVAFAQGSRRAARRAFGERSSVGESAGISCCPGVKVVVTRPSIRPVPLVRLTTIICPEIAALPWVSKTSPSKRHLGGVGQIIRTFGGCSIGAGGQRSRRLRHAGFRWLSCRQSSGSSRNPPASACRPRVIHDIASERGRAIGLADGKLVKHADLKPAARHRSCRPGEG